MCMLSPSALICSSLSHVCATLFYSMISAKNLRPFTRFSSITIVPSSVLQPNNLSTSLTRF
uniref:Uncharacterized protein n=1 Tax=Arundo donax TaxID=35708 RepID=A0A0A9EJU0_ARUDO